MLRTDEFTFFWGAADPFSNWHPAPFTHRDLRFAQAEQWMMLCKARLFGDDAMAAAILAEADPAINKKQGRKVRGFVAQEWNEHCRRYVYVGNREKYRQNPALMEALLDSAPTTLVEASPYDRIWGIGLGISDPRIHTPAQWQGTNWLGQVLTRLRSDFLAARNP